MRQCKYCKKEKAIWRGENSGFRPYCKSCRPISELITRYGLSEEEAKKQYNISVCDICCAKLEREHRTKRSKRIDHDHKTGEFRGILCDSCNKGLGFFYDNIDSLTRAIDYLKRK